MQNIIFVWMGWPVDNTKTKKDKKKNIPQNVNIQNIEKQKIEFSSHVPNTRLLGQKLWPAAPLKIDRERKHWAHYHSFSQFFLLPYLVVVQ